MFLCMHVIWSGSVKALNLSIVDYQLINYKINALAMPASKAPRLYLALVLAIPENVPRCKVPVDEPLAGEVPHCTGNVLAPPQHPQRVYLQWAAGMHVSNERNM